MYSAYLHIRTTSVLTFSHPNEPLKTILRSTILRSNPSIQKSILLHDNDGDVQLNRSQ